MFQLLMREMNQVAQRKVNRSVNPYPYHYQNYSKSHTYLKITKGCQTVDGEDCVFPFIYKEKTYNECTKEESTEPWCATSVMKNGEVIPKHWGDCKDISDCFNGEKSGEESEDKGG